MAMEENEGGHRRSDMVKVVAENALLYTATSIDPSSDSMGRKKEKRANWSDEPILMILSDAA